MSSFTQLAQAYHSSAQVLLFAGAAVSLLGAGRPRLVALRHLVCYLSGIREFPLKFYLLSAVLWVEDLCSNTALLSLRFIISVHCYQPCEAGSVQTQHLLFLCIFPFSP